MLAGLISIDRSSAVPLPEQVYRALREAIGAGRLAAGARLPSSRALAAALGISRNSVNAAYELLVAEGIVTVRGGSVPKVSAAAGTLSEGEAPAIAARAVALSARGRAMSSDPWSRTERRRGGKLEPGTPSLDRFPADDWARTLRRVTRRLRGDVLSYGETRGLPELRRELAAYLTAERGVRATPERILVTPSTQASLTLLANSLADPGEAAWLEDPGYLGARAAFTAAGLDIVPMPVDAEGADPRRVADRRPPRLIYVTPSHQYPFGTRMSLARRAMVLEAARACGGVVLEDDYDSEFLFSGRPLAAMQGLGAEGEVIYLGTFSKSMLPGLRVAYMVVPEHLAAPLTVAQRVSGMLANVTTQAALAEFIASGRYRAHLRRVQQTCEARGRDLASALRQRLGDAADVPDPVGGVQLALRFTGAVDDLAVAARVNALGFSVAALSPYGIDCGLSGLVIGFAGAQEGEAQACAEAVAGAVAGAIAGPVKRHA